MLARVLLRHDAGSGFVQPLVAAGVIEVPVSVDQLLDRVHIDARQSRGNVWPRGDDSCIHEELSVGAGKNGDISTRAQKNADIAAKGFNCDLRRGSFLERIFN
jgi:hypothetical protein